MKIIGFTLFWNGTKKCWQKSVKRDDEDGWFVEHISEEEAENHLRNVASSLAMSDAQIAYRRLNDALNRWADVLA